MKGTLLLLLIIIMSASGLAQDNGRIQRIQNHLELLSVDNTGLAENLKLDINVANVTLTNFLLAVSKVHNVNINVDPGLQNITIVNNFSNVAVSDLLVFLCKQYDLDISFTGNILSIAKYVPPPLEPEEKVLRIDYDPLNDLISMDLKNDPLAKVFRGIMDVSGRNLLYNAGMEGLPLTLYLNKVPFDTAMEKLAGSNGMEHSKSRDGFYLFDALGTPNTVEGAVQNIQSRPQRRARANTFYYQVTDTLDQMLNVDFENVPLADIVREISYDLKLDVYLAAPLEQAGTVSFRAKQIHYDTLLERIFESLANNNGTVSNNRGQNMSMAQNTAQTGVAQGGGPFSFSFKKEGGVYFFGTTDQLSVRRIEVIQMMHRSVELLGDPTPYQGGNRSAGRTVSAGVNYMGSGMQDGYQNGQNFNNGQLSNNSPTSSRRISTQSNSFGDYDSNAEALINILPDDIKADLDIKIDVELNSFLVSGPSANIDRFKKFIKQIDRPVPVILIEVMLIEVKKSATVETGISWGIGDSPTETKGGIFPQTDLTLGAKTVNKVIGGFDGFGSFNIGKVVPNFFATIKALEENGTLKIRSTPKLSTLNGHRANLSIGETTYYVVTSQNYFGSQIPSTSEIRNYQPIDAELAISIKPLVSGNGQVTLDINVVQSDFSGERIEDDAPPGLTSREFSSIIRMQDQDLAVLGGLEEKVKNDSGSGVPLLARIPVIKWLFSTRKREDSKQKLTILIKPTVIY